MSDILENLSYAYSGWADSDQIKQALWEARTEIEQLRERIREAAKLNMRLMELRSENEVEIERLRGLLQEFLTDGEDLVVGIHDDWLRRVHEKLGK